MSESICPRAAIDKYGVLLLNKLACRRRMEINITLLNSFVAVLPDTTNGGVESIYYKEI